MPKTSAGDVAKSVAVGAAASPRGHPTASHCKLLDVLWVGGVASSFWPLVAFQQPNATNSCEKHPLAAASCVSAQLAKDRCAAFTEQDLVNDVIGRWRMFEENTLRAHQRWNASQHPRQQIKLVAPSISESSEKSQQAPAPQSRADWKINWMTDRLGLPDEIQVVGRRLFQLAHQLNFTRGRRTSHVAASCLLNACRRTLSPVALADFATLLHVPIKTIGRVYVKFLRCLACAPGNEAAQFISDLSRIDDSILGKQRRRGATQASKRATHARAVCYRSAVVASGSKGKEFAHQVDPDPVLDEKAFWLEEQEIRTLASQLTKETPVRWKRLRRLAPDSLAGTAAA